MDHDPVDDLETADKKMRDAEREIEKLGLTQSDFEKVDQDFQYVLQEIAGDKTLERFRLEYQKLHKTLKTSHDTEKKLIKKCKELNSDIAANSVKVQIALKLSNEDNIAMEQVKQDVDRTWKLVDAAREKEENAKKKLAEQKYELSEVRRKVDSNDIIPQEQQNLLHELKKKKDEVLDIKDEKINKLKDIRNTNSDLIKKKNDLEDRKANLQSLIKGLKDAIQMSNTEAESQEARKKKLEEQLEETKVSYENKQVEVRKKEMQKIEISKELKELQKEIEFKREDHSLNIEKIKSTSITNEKLSENLKKSEEDNQTLIIEAQKKELEIRKYQEELNRKEEENSKIYKEILTLKKKIGIVRQEKLEVKALKDFSKESLDNLNKSNLELRKENEHDKKNIEDLMRDINTMNKECIDMENLVRLHSDEEIMKKNEYRKITNEVKSSKKEIAKLKALIYQLKRDEDKYSLEASNAYSKYIQTLEQVKYKKSMITQLQKDNVEAEAKLKQQQNLYEAVRSDRNIYSKTLLESNDEKDELRRKFKILEHQIIKLREEISSKNNSIRELTQQYTNLQEENSSNEQKKKRCEEKKKEKESYIRNYENQISKLKYYIASVEQERMKQKKEYEMVINDRDILGTQLIKRNEELASLYEKIKIQQSTLAKGEVQYQKKVLDINDIKLHISELKKEYFIAKGKISCIPELKRELNRLQKDLMEVKTKVKALSEELQNPMNVHRYRKLEGTKPETYEMITKIQTLQRRLIAKTEEVSEKEFLIQEKEKLYIELKNILARQPKPAVAEQLSVYQDNLKEKSKQMKNMIKELNAAHAQVNHYRFEIDRLNKDINDIKEKWFAMKKKENRLQSIPEEEN
jgi:chromosome segregation ATPase